MVECSASVRFCRVGFWKSFYPVTEYAPIANGAQKAFFPKTILMLSSRHANSRYRAWLGAVQHQANLRLRIFTSSSRRIPGFAAALIWSLGLILVGTWHRGHARPFAVNRNPGVVVMAPDSTTRLAGSIARFLNHYTTDTSVSRRASDAIVQESGRTHLDASLLVGVMLVENPDIRPGARNPNSGALGLMQVMPLHAGEYSCGTRSLRQIESNICHGARLLASLVREAHGSRRQALLHYNGCRTGSVTPTCFSYPEQVSERARRARRYLASAMTSRGTE